jgi:uncharacterized protein (DUF983 family)
VKGFARALALHCPRCGGGGIFRHWFALRAACPRCGLALDRGEADHWVGAYAFNLIASEIIGIGAAVLWIASQWPDVPWDAVQIGVPAIMVAAPIAFFPWSRTLWLAWDLRFRPAEGGRR